MNETNFTIGPIPLFQMALFIVMHLYDYSTLYTYIQYSLFYIFFNILTKLLSYICLAIDDGIVIKHDNTLQQVILLLHIVCCLPPRCCHIH